MKISPLGDELHFGRTDIQDMNLSLFGIWERAKENETFHQRTNTKTLSLVLHTWHLEQMCVGLLDTPIAYD